MQPAVFATIYHVNFLACEECDEVLKTVSNIFISQIQFTSIISQIKCIHFTQFTLFTQILKY